MNICPKCGFENKVDSAESCEKCGAQLTGNTEKSINTPDSDQDNQLDFVVTETTGGGAPDFLTSGDDNPKKSDSKADIPDSDKLEITSNANLLEDSDSDDHNHYQSDNESGPIGDSSSNLIPDNYLKDSNQPPNEQKLPVDKKHLTPLSQEEVVNIRKKMYGDDDDPAKNRKLSKTEKPVGNEQPSQPDEITVESTNHPPNSLRPINDPAKMPAIEKAGKVRGVAFFKKNFIQLAGTTSLHNGDEIVVNDRPYLLRPKKLSRKVTIGTFVAALVILLTIIGAQFISPTVSGNGEIIGMILDADGEPYLEGARVNIRSLNKSVISNPQGFFRFDMIPTGTYQVAYDLDGVYAGMGNVTVTAGQTTLMSFGGSDAELTNEETSPIITERQPQKESQPKAELSKPIAQQKSSKSKKKKSSNNNSKKSSPGYGKVELNVNLNDARFSVDNEVLGAGSNTFSKITSGKRTIKVYKPGYVEYTDQVDIKKNKTATINVTLERNENLSKESLSADEWINLGDGMLSSGKYQQAIKDYTNAISRSPGMIKAYHKRADLYVTTGEKSKAASDYIRIGEIYRVKGKPANAVSVFTSALEINPKDKVALTGRGGAWMDQGDYRPALVDLDAALDKDKKFYPALVGAGICEFKMGDYKKADKYFKNAYKTNKNDPFLYQYMMLNYLAKDDIKKVRKMYSEFKDNTSAKDLAEFKASSKSEPILRLIKEEDR